MAVENAGRWIAIFAAPVAVALVAIVAFAADKPPATDRAEQYSGKFFKAEESITTGSANGVAYQAIAGTIVVHPDDWNDAAQNGGAKNPDAKGDDDQPDL